MSEIHLRKEEADRMVRAIVAECERNSAEECENGVCPFFNGEACIFDGLPIFWEVPHD